MTLAADDPDALPDGREPGHEWLGLEPLGDGRLAFVLTPALARFDARLFGGTGLAVAIAAIEAESGRGALWATVQFAGSAEVGERIDCRVEVLAAGRTVSQVRLTASVGDRLVLAALGAAAERRDDAFEAKVRTMPEVAAPADSPPLELAVPTPFPDVAGLGPFAMAEFRQAAGARGSQQTWARMRDAPPSRATLGYLADFVPSAVVSAAGRVGGGMSLDNSIRFGPEPPADTDWVLIDYDPYFADNGYVHGAARLWSVDGTLLAVASQTAAARLLD